MVTPSLSDFKESSWVHATVEITDWQRDETSLGRLISQQEEIERELEFTRYWVTWLDDCRSPSKVGGWKCEPNSQLGY